MVLRKRVTVMRLRAWDGFQCKTMRGKFLATKYENHLHWLVMQIQSRFEYKYILHSGFKLGYLISTNYIILTFLQLNRNIYTVFITNWITPVSHCSLLYVERNIFTYCVLMWFFWSLAILLDSSPCTVQKKHKTMDSVNSTIVVTQIYLQNVIASHKDRTRGQL